MTSGVIDYGQYSYPQETTTVTEVYEYDEEGRVLKMTRTTTTVKHQQRQATPQPYWWSGPIGGSIMQCSPASGTVTSNNVYLFAARDEEEPPDAVGALA